MEQHQKSLMQSLHWLQTSKEYSDLKIICKDKTFHVHKAIVCSRSKYFATSCKPEWGEDDSSKKEIILSDDNSRLIGLMLDYLYQLDYEDIISRQVLAQEIAKPLPGPEDARAMPTGFETFFGHSPPTPGNYKTKIQYPKLKLKKQKGDILMERLVVNTMVYAIADKYELEPLKTLAKEKFALAVKYDWESQAFLRAAELAFETTPSSDRGMRDLVVNAMNEHRSLMDYEDTQKLLESANGIAYALLQVVLKPARPSEYYHYGM